jgi:hypothetical protein
MKPTSPASPTLAKIEWAAAGALTLIVCWLHFIVLRNAGGLWVDEVTSVVVARASSLAEFWSLLPFDSFPVPFYALLRAWTAIAGSDGWRLFGFLVGLSIVAALWFNARILGRSLPLISLAVFGMNTPCIHSGDMIRGYGVGTLFMLLTLGLVWKLAQSPSRLVALLAALSAVGAVQFLYQNAVFVFAACAAGMAITLRSRFWKRTALVLAVGALAALSLIPYVPLMVIEHKMLAPWQAFKLEQAIIVTLRTLHGSGRLMAVLWGGLLLVGVGTAVLAQFPKIFKFTSARRDLLLYSTVAFIIGFIGFWAFFKALGLEMTERYYISILALAAVVLDAVAAALREVAWRRWAVLSVSAAILCASFPTAWKSSHWQSTNIDQIAARIAATAAREDFIVVLPWFHGATFRYHYRGVTPWTTLPELEDYRVSREDQLRVKLATPNAAAPVLERISRTLQSGHRLWVVGEPGFVPEGQMPPSLPPAPFGPRGWYPMPYERVWALEMGYLLQHHAVRCTLLISPPADVSSEESVPLAIFEGWH